MGLKAAQRAPSYLVVEGPIGVGKTSLTRRLADHFSARCLLEQAEDNPFLDRFYQNREGFAFATQLSFLLQRSEQFRNARQQELFGAPVVADFMLQKDQLFAELNLDAEELGLYNAVCERFSPSAPVPELVVYLQAPVDTLLRRIKMRGRPQENRIDRAYLERLCESYAGFFHRFQQTALLIVNAAAIDPVHDDRHFDLLVERILATHSGRHFFNPGQFDF